MEQIRQFYEKVNASETLQAKLNELAEREAGFEELAKFAENEGFNFTEEDMMALVKKNKSGELSDDDLAAVVGGLKISFEPPPEDPWHRPVRDRSSVGIRLRFDFGK
ncbi:MAG: Nif11-like leader peptide family RiPP precursor [Chitinispirillales bacterium]|jgi:predicted ribosomally synthesized peptide with nif11-like leader|nr:Nif11-like leader peptide family RiPP precursor [Chitinispirillales bacterium]